MELNIRRPVLIGLLIIVIVEYVSLGPVPPLVSIGLVYVLGFLFDHYNPALGNHPLSIPGIRTLEKLLEFLHITPARLILLDLVTEIYLFVLALHRIVKPAASSADLYIDVAATMLLFAIGWNAILGQIPKQTKTPDTTPTPK